MHSSTSATEAPRTTSFTPMVANARYCQLAIRSPRRTVRRFGWTVTGTRSFIFKSLTSTKSKRLSYDYGFVQVQDRVGQQRIRSKLGRIKVLAALTRQSSTIARHPTARVEISRRTCWNSSSRTCDSRVSGYLAMTMRNKNRRRSPVVLPPSRKTLSASFLAASTCCTSFINCRAWSGVLLRSRRLQDIRGWCVEVRHERWRSGTLDIGVDASSIQRITMILEVVSSVAVTVSDRFPNVGWLIDLIAGTAHGATQEAADSQRIVANLLGIQSHSGSSCQVTVLGGPFRVIRQSRSTIAETPGCRREFADQLLDVPTIFAKL